MGDPHVPEDILTPVMTSTTTVSSLQSSDASFTTTLSEVGTGSLSATISSSCSTDDES